MAATTLLVSRAVVGSHRILPTPLSNTLVLRNRCFSSASSSSSATLPPSGVVVVSRRWVEAHRRMFPRINKSSTTADKAEDKKPWPRSMIIAGCSVAAVVIPYSLAWILTTNDTFRHFLFQRYPAVEPILRRHFGTLEMDRPYIEVIQQQGGRVGAKEEKIDAQHYLLTGELPCKFRARQQLIEAHCQSPLTVRICTYHNENDDPNQHGDCTHVTLFNGTIAACRESLLQLMGKSTDTDNITPDMYVTVDFEEDEVQPELESSTMGNVKEELMSMDGNDKQDTISNKNLSLSQRTQIFSLWHHVLSMPTTSMLPDLEMNVPSDWEANVSRIEYQIALMEKDLKDPNCHREIDVMQNELKAAKKELSRLKWERRRWWWWKKQA